MSILKRKIEQANAGGTIQTSPVLATACDKSMDAVFHGWLDETGWSIETVESGWEKPETTDIGLSSSCIYKVGIESGFLVLCLDEGLALRASSRAFGLDGQMDDPSRELSDFERHYAEEFVSNLWRQITCRDEAGDQTQWLSSLDVKDLATAAGPVLKIIYALSHESLDKPFSITVFATNLPLAEHFSHLSEQNPDNGDAVEWGLEKLSERLGPCRLPVHVIADRVELDVASCTRLEIGQVLPLPRIRFDQVRVDLVTSGKRRSISHATLGLDAGQKAVRLNDAPDPSFFETIEKINEKASST